MASDLLLRPERQQPAHRRADIPASQSTPAAAEPTTAPSPAAATNHDGPTPQPGHTDLIWSTLFNEQDTAIIHRYLNGATIQQLAASVGRSYQAIRMLLDVAGVLRTPGVGARPARDHPVFLVPDTTSWLNGREVAVLRLLAAGASIATTAQQLQLNPDLIGKARTRVYRKLRAHTAPHAVSLAHQHGLFDHHPLNRPDPSTHTGQITLTDREQTLLRLTAAGSNPSDLGHQLQLNTPAVTDTRRALHAALHARNDSHLITRAYQTRLLTPNPAAHPKQPIDEEPHSDGHRIRRRTPG